MNKYSFGIVMLYSNFSAYLLGNNYDTNDNNDDDNDDIMYNYKI